MDTILPFPFLVLAGAICLSLLTRAIASRGRNHNRLPYPPGPQGYPIIGNILSIPTKKAWLVYNEWSKRYGDLMYFEALGQSFLVLGSLSRTNDLLDKRSTIYSGRPRLPMIHDLMEWGYNFGFMTYGPEWREHRRTFTRHYHSNAIHKYHHIQVQEARRFLHRLLTYPSDFHAHLRMLFGAIIMNINYGIQISDPDDKYIANAEAVVRAFEEVGVPGRFLVDMFPILKYIPTWFPGAGFKRKAAAWKELNETTINKPFGYAVQSTIAGIGAPSIASTLIEELPDVGDPKREHKETVARNTTAVAYVGELSYFKVMRLDLIGDADAIAGADTTFVPSRTFFLAMAMHPAAQRKAQAEIDSLIGGTRLPDFSDRDKLVYVNAVVKELMRWITPVPLGVPHMCTEDDEYDGYFIPKGTIVVGNSWSIQNDPQYYPEPSEFRPERFIKNGKLDPDVLDPKVAFGFGRRVCPGMFLSDETLFILVSSVLAVFDITPPVDAMGNPIELKVQVKPGQLSGPEPFNCIIKPRSAAAVKLIKEAFVDDISLHMK